MSCTDSRHVTNDKFAPRSAQMGTIGVIIPREYVPSGGCQDDVVIKPSAHN